MFLNGYFSLDFGNPNSCENNRKRIRATEAVTATIREVTMVTYEALHNTNVILLWQRQRWTY